MRIALEPFFLIIPFLLTGVWIVLYRARRVDVHVYHHTDQEAPQRLTTRPTVGPASYRVVEDSRSAKLARIEAGLTDISRMLKG